MRGKVVRWLGTHGFIRGQDKRVYFTHISAVKTGEVMYQGARVEFDGSENEVGLQATNVKGVKDDV